VIVVEAGGVKTYVAAEEAPRIKERQDETEFATKIGGKTSLGPRFFCLVKISFRVTHFMPYNAETGCSRPLIGRLYRQLYCLFNTKID
jgi:hypothetical protein